MQSTVNDDLALNRQRVRETRTRQAELWNRVMLAYGKLPYSLRGRYGLGRDKTAQLENLAVLLEKLATSAGTSELGR